MSNLYRSKSEEKIYFWGSIFFIVLGIADLVTPFPLIATKTGVIIDGTPAIYIDICLIVFGLQFLRLSDLKDTNRFFNQFYKNISFNCLLLIIVISFIGSVITIFLEARIEVIQNITEVFDGYSLWKGIFGIKKPYLIIILSSIGIGLIISPFRLKKYYYELIFSGLTVLLFSFILGHTI